jgi:cytochrome c peroxidase
VKLSFQIYVIIFGGFSLFLASCVKESDNTLEHPFEYKIPQLIYPTDNQDDSLRVLLGRHLFYDPALSLDSTISCANCHIQQFAFADTSRFSRGIEGRMGRRNSPSLINIAYAPYLMREGAVPTLEMQVLVPIQEHEEFDFNILEVVERLKKQPKYVQWSEQAYGRELDAFVLTRSIAAFERRILGLDAPFDEYLRDGRANAISQEAIRGMRLFYSDSLACGKCHSGALLTNFSFKNNGLYREYSDPGRYRATGKLEDIGVFKVPSLRNVARTAPYMHDGSLKSLDAVLNHYAQGGAKNELQDSLIKGFSLSEVEKKAIVSFLETLTERRVYVANELSKPGF